MRDVAGATLRSTLSDLFVHPFDSPLSDDEFNAIAMRVFAHQYSRNKPYAGYCDRRGRTPATTGHWTGIPAVPTVAFKEVTLITGDATAAEAVFRTSGTTRGAERRGVHHVPDISLYHMSLIPNFAGCVLPDGAELRMLSLVPHPRELPDSSLAHMIDVVMDRMGSPRSGYYASADDGIDTAALTAALRDAEGTDEPVCLLGTSLAYVRWLDELDRAGDRFRLPAKSRLMDTGGYKGHGRQVDEEGLRAMYGELLGLPADHCVNEYGMTEMLSQFYDSTLRDAVLGRSGERRKLVPPWVRTRIVDPETLDPLPAGQPGLLQHFDPANAGSVMAIQTEDVGVAVTEGFRLLGRASGATPRGCSIAMDILLQAVDARRR
ncbi:MAG: long-chain fatty acid--CoA ligase [Gemmatimonadetes bacterium]|nr:long-chain fatty acid--CoA ligase [Gemmatimonadota bacterium]